MDAPELLIGFLLVAGVVWAVYNRIHPASPAPK